MNPMFQLTLILISCVLLTLTSAQSTSNATCVLDPEVNDGLAYFVTSPFITISHNISSNQDGIPLRIILSVIELSDCSLIANPIVDVWQCNALGEYSQTSSNDSAANPPFLRAEVEVDTAQGYIMFDTIFPGWYAGRAPHINIRIRLANGHVVHNGQIFFSDAISAAVALVAPYTSNTVPRTFLTADTVFASQQGQFGVLNAGVVNSTTGLEGGLIGNVNVVVNSTANFPITVPAPAPAAPAPSASPVAPAPSSSPVSPAPAPSAPAAANETAPAGANTTVPAPAGNNSTLPVAPAGNNSTFPVSPAPLPAAPAPFVDNSTQPLAPAGTPVVPVPTTGSVAPQATPTTPTPANVTAPANAPYDLSSFGLSTGGYGGVSLLLFVSLISIF